MDINKALDILIELQTILPKTFACFGTALGCIREGNIIEHDLDVDMGLLYEDFKLEELFYTVQIHDYYIKGANKYRIPIWKDGIKTDIHIYYKFDDLRYDYLGRNGSICLSHPSSSIEKIKEIEINGYKIRTLGEKYLNVVYGEDWEVVKKDFNWKTDHKNRI